MTNEKMRPIRVMLFTAGRQNVQIEDLRQAIRPQCVSHVVLLDFEGVLKAGDYHELQARIEAGLEVLDGSQFDAFLKDLTPYVANLSAEFYRHEDLVLSFSYFDNTYLTLAGEEDLVRPILDLVERLVRNSPTMIDS
ncbi:hypothetical protein [Terrihabitans rhizophilus]|uniref:Uncharacterized protein n=1 Tax=Terrihabitans rhizophilus TaxID=3092662 RepID=A0ABU4RQ10_9HYPH|nr:hypothetical protein [Terrihabitans sp. PJ23]MDX6806283.1 hypothetical protein [Terrihabitans sp. PJ23]